MPNKTKPQPSPALAHHPFAALAARVGRSADAQAIAVAPVEPKTPLRAVIRLERKGRGGKEVTVIEQLDLDAHRSGEWLHGIKAALGCGGVEKDGVWVLQGDQRSRASQWLQEHGVKHVTVGA